MVHGASCHCDAVSRAILSHAAATCVLEAGRCHRSVARRRCTVPLAVRVQCLCRVTSTPQAARRRPALPLRRVSVVSTAPTAWRHRVARVDMDRHRTTPRRRACTAVPLGEERSGVVRVCQHSRHEDVFASSCVCAPTATTARHSQSCRRPASRGRSTPTHRRLCAVACVLAAGTVPPLPPRQGYAFPCNTCRTVLCRFRSRCS